MAEKRAARNAAAKARNEAANPKRKGPPGVAAPRPLVKAQEHGRGAEERAEASPQKPMQRQPIATKAERRVSKKAASPATRVAIALLLAVGLLVGFWLLFRLPAPNGQH